MNGTTEISEAAFAECESLVSATMPPSVTEIGELAFRGCAALQKVREFQAL